MNGKKRLESSDYPIYNYQTKVSKEIRLIINGEGPALAQLVEQQTVVVHCSLSAGHRFESDKPEI